MPNDCTAWYTKTSTGMVSYVLGHPVHGCLTNSPQHNLPLCITFTYVLCPTLQWNSVSQFFSFNNLHQWFLTSLETLFKDVFLSCILTSVTKKWDSFTAYLQHNDICQACDMLRASKYLVNSFRTFNVKYSTTNARKKTQETWLRRVYTFLITIDYLWNGFLSFHF